ncbi:MAG: glycosyltransferase [Actinomycetes bacterium]
MTSPAASVLLVARNAASTIGAQLDALARQAFSEPWEIVVVDDGSTDATTAIVDGRLAAVPWLRRIEGPGHGVGAARNAALAAARADVLLMVDADDEVAPGWLAAMAGALAQSQLVAGALDIDALNPEWVRNTRGRAIADGPSTFAGVVPFANSCNMGMRRAVLDQIGGFDESLQAGEDIEFSYRAARAGIPVTYVAAAVVRYRYRTSLGALWRQATAYGRARRVLEARLRADGVAVPDAHIVRGWLGVARRVPHAVRRSRRADLVFATGNLWGRTGGMR